MNIPRWLAMLTYKSHEDFEDAMMELYSDIIHQLSNRALAGSRWATVRADLDRVGVYGKMFTEKKIAAIMQRMLEADGLRARVTHSGYISVIWDSVPPHWSNDN